MRECLLSGKSKIIWKLFKLFFLMMINYRILLKRISWESATLGFWFTDLLDRNTQFNTWLFQGRPNVFWMTGFFNPQVNNLLSYK